MDVAIINAQRFVLTFLALYFRAASVGCGFLGAAFTRKGVDHVFRALWLSRFWGRGFSTIGDNAYETRMTSQHNQRKRRHRYIRISCMRACARPVWSIWTFCFALPSVPGANLPLVCLLALFVIEFFAFAC